ncbi:hypothetical protein [Metabacillus niabensis]|uniref:ABC transporter permease n=1 Tax=Metabacillus niabensis TaxID=324854 RepID=A0ABT9Z6E1_9BACI|nr:hypothetical protein [Metabacillus niabensis]MDQ0227814.1 hypothetical protein [Metabacillus niabensis]
MSQPRIYPKVATDMFFTQWVWAFNFLSVVFIIQIVRTVYALFNGSEQSSYFDVAFVGANIFMLVIGIISAIAFLPHFVSNGVTRKDYFKGTLIGTIGVALAIPVVSAIVSSLLEIILKLMNLLPSIAPYSGNNGADEDNLVAELVISVIFTPYVDLGSNWLVSILIFALNIFTYYVAGWLIGAAFSRLGLLGIVSILLAFILVYVEDLLLSISLGLPVPSFVETLDVPVILSIIGVLVALGIVCWIIRLLTKRMIVKY